jgi:uncharacterized membrane protein YkvA (DUF1232 family)
MGTVSDRGAKRRISDKQARDALETAAKRVKPADVEKLVEREHDVNAKVKDVPGKFMKLVNQVKLLFSMIRDYWKGEYKDVPWSTIAAAVGALVYFLSPVDMIPDVIPVIGYIDDAAVVALAVKFVQDDLRKYCTFKNLAPEQYFEAG